MVPPENFAEQVERQKEKPKLDRKKKMLKMDNLEFGSSCCCCEEVGEETTVNNLVRWYLVMQNQISLFQSQWNSKVTMDNEQKTLVNLFQQILVLSGFRTEYTPLQK